MDEIALAVIILVILIVALMVWDQCSYIKEELVTQEIDIGDISGKNISGIKQTGTDAEFDRIFGKESFDDVPIRPAMVPEEDLPKRDPKTWFRDLDPARLRNKVELSEISHDGKRQVAPLPQPDATGYYNPMPKVGATEQFY